MAEYMLKAENVQKSYGTFLALDNFECEIPHGITGLLGPNGAGKTTFIRSLLGIHDMDHGSIQFLEWELPRQIGKARDFIGYQPEVPTLIKKVSAMKYVSHMCKIAGLAREPANQRAFDVLHYVGLGEARYREMDKFSQGMLQKVKLATALVHDPILLITDEPTAGCDPESREQILSLIEDLGKEYGKTILISTHLLPDIERTANYVVVMSQGKRLIQGDLRTILAHKNMTSKINIRVTGDHHNFVEVLQQNGFDVLDYTQYSIECVPPHEVKNVSLRIFELAKKMKSSVQMISNYRQSLEEVFLDMIEEDEHNE